MFLSLNTYTNWASLAYNIAEAGIVFVKNRSPDQVRKEDDRFLTAFFLDVPANCLGIVQLTNQMSEEYEDFYKKHDWTFYSLAAISTLAVFVASAIITINVSRIFKPVDLTINGKQIFYFKDAVFTLSPSSVGLFRQWLIINRAVLNILSALISENPRVNLLSAAIQMTTALNISHDFSRMAWMGSIEMERTFLNPFSGIKKFEVDNNLGIPADARVFLSGTEKKENYPGTVQKMTTTFYITLPNTCTKECLSDPTQLETLMRTIYDYSSTAFENSTWNRYLKSDESSRKSKLIYVARLVRQRLNFTGCLENAYVSNIAATVFYSFKAFIHGHLEGSSDVDIR